MEEFFYCILASEEEKNKMNVQDYSLNFAHRIIRLYQYLIKKREFILSKQIIRSGTSIGANIREAQRAQSIADFLSKMKIALKEADETHYWLILLRNNGYIPVKLADSLLNDCSRIIKMLAKITFSSQQLSSKKL